MKIIVTESIAKEGIDFLVERGFEVDTKFGLSHTELLDIIHEYDAIIVRSVTKVNKELIDRAVKLKVAGRAGNGIDNIDVDECTAKGIICVNTPESNIMAAGELAVAMAYAIFRNLYQAVYAGRNKDFRRGKFIGRELDGKTAGIIGLGRIGSIVASKLKGSNMKVVAYDPYIADEKFKKYGIERCSKLEDLLRKSDLITLHTPKTAETKGIIGAKELEICKDGVRIVNAARGGLVDEDALYDALVSGKVAAAAIDVLDPEPNYNTKPEVQTYENRLLSLDNLIATPHLGASTDEANLNVGTAVTELVADALNGEMVAAVNMPKISGDLSEAEPFIKLGEMLGKIYYQTEKKTAKKIEIVYSGDLADMETKLISYSVIKGFLTPVVKETVNYVNAEMILENSGVELVESKTKQLEKYTNLITVNFVNDERTLSVSGTVFAKDSLRLTNFYGYQMDFEPTRHVLALQNIDRPGIIGKVGTEIGNWGVNISAMQWGSKKHGSKAVSFLSVERDIEEENLKKLSELEGVLLVSKITF